MTGFVREVGCGERRWSSCRSLAKTRQIFSTRLGNGMKIQFTNGELARRDQKTLADWCLIEGGRRIWTSSPISGNVFGS